MKVHNYPSDVTREQFEIIRTEKAGSSGECCLLKKLVEVERKWQDRETFPTLATIKNTDTANKVSRIKLHIAVDILGLPLAMHLKTAGKSDKAGATSMLAFNFSNLLGTGRRRLQWYVLCFICQNILWRRSRSC